MTISVVAENVLYKIQYSFIIKLLNKLYLECMCFSAIWITYDKHHIILNEKKLHFFFKMGNKTWLLSLLPVTKTNSNESNDVNARHEIKRGKWLKRRNFFFFLTKKIPKAQETKAKLYQWDLLN